jgi:hypothetical protein
MIFGVPYLDVSVGVAVVELGDRDTGSLPDGVQVHFDDLQRREIQEENRAVWTHIHTQTHTHTHARTHTHAHTPGTCRRSSSCHLGSHATAHRTGQTCLNNDDMGNEIQKFRVKKNAYNRLPIQSYEKHTRIGTPTKTSVNTIALNAK